MKYLKPALAIGFVIGALVCANAWARPGHGFHGGGHGGYPAGHMVGHPAGPGYGHGYYHHGRGYGRGVVVGLALGAPLFWPGYGYGDPFYDPYFGRYYFSRPVYMPPLEPGMPPVSWYCRNPAGYYPQVTECLVPWRVVSVAP